MSSQAALPLLYTGLADWFHLLTRPSDYAVEAELYRQAIDSVVPQPAQGDARRTMLELGAGGGNTASHLKQHFRLVLTDLSPAMLGVSSKLNPELEHIQGDMRALRLDREFDVVFLHDAVMYMTSEDDLRAALTTAAIHTRVGGAVLVVPDFTRETFRAGVHAGGHDGWDVTPAQPGRALRYLEWTRDPDPDGTTCTVDFAYLLLEADGTVRAFADRHTFGVFPRATWLRLLGECGFGVTALPFEHPDVERAQRCSWESASRRASSTVELGGRCWQDSTPAPGSTCVDHVCLSRGGIDVKVFISADLEGIAGVAGNGQLGESSPDMPRIRRLLTAEINAAIEGAFRGGATGVLVNDGHGNGANVLCDELDPRARLMIGFNQPLSQMGGIDGSFAAMFFIGHHAMEGTTQGVYNHTFFGRLVNRISLNGRPSGEMGVNGAIAGHFGVPVALAVGDDHAVAEALTFFPGIETVTTKRGLDRFVADSLSPAESRRLITAAAEVATRRAASLAPACTTSPVTFEVEFKSTAATTFPLVFPSVQRTGPKSVSVTGLDVPTAFAMLNGVLLLGQAGL